METLCRHFILAQFFCASTHFGRIPICSFSVNYLMWYIFFNMCDPTPQEILRTSFKRFVKLSLFKNTFTVF